MPNHHYRQSSGTALVPLAAVVAPVVLALLHLWTTAAAAAAEPPMGLPHCPTMCGNVSVPYPFGISDGCFLPGFNLTCDHTQDPPKLLLGAGAGATGVQVQVQVSNIFLQNASMRVMSRAILNHTSDSIPEANGTWGFLDGRGSGPFVLSYHRNSLFVVGCNIQATLLRNDTQLITGCSSFCTMNDMGNLLRGPASVKGYHNCTGNGCCKASIPLYHPSYDVRLKSLSLTKNFTPRMPNLVFIGERNQIDEVWCQHYIGNSSLPGRSPQPAEQPAVVPVLLEWAMASTAPLSPGLEKDNASRCPSDRATSACKSRNSICIDMNSPFRSGYSCSCLPGYDGNPYLEDGCQDINECEDPEGYQCYGECTNLFGTYECRCPWGSHGNSSMMHGCVKSSTGLIIGLGLGSGATVLVIAISTTLLIHKVKVERKKRLRRRFFKQNHGQLLQQLVCQRADIGERMIITLEEIEKATNNFDKSRELGGGGHGIVYKGILSSQHVAAIKKAKIVIQKEINEFINEVAILSQVNHRNIVKLLGCCLETEAPLLVYEFISNGTLYKHLHARAPTSISWENRLRIAVETARALTYLHSLVSTPVVHRDIKSPNILLDDNLTVKLSDFGASRYLPIDQEGIHTTVQGTLGYLDPMYHSTGLLTEKSDVYSFGVLLIELLTRENPNCYRSHQGFALVNHFSSLLSQGNLIKILDPQVAKEGDGEVVDVALLAAICVKFRAEERPMMRHVEMTLESIQSSKEFSSDVTDDDISSEDNIQYAAARSWD